MKNSIVNLGFYLTLSLLACKSEHLAQPNDTSCSGTLFGTPMPGTGLSEDQCKPECSCGGDTWKMPSYSSSDLANLRSWKMETPIASIEVDPYLSSVEPISEGSVCAVMVLDAEAKTYRLQTFASEELARAAGGKVTHGGVCGACSTLHDLAVYIEKPDLTTPVRKCGIDFLNGPKEKHIACLSDLGFTEACAQIWYYNTVHTKKECFDTCISSLGKPYHEPTGELNACLACDEEKSGAVFKAVAGRTRRNTGVASALCRPCSEVMHLEHRY